MCYVLRHISNSQADSYNPLYNLLSAPFESLFCTQACNYRNTSPRQRAPEQHWTASVLFKSSEGGDFHVPLQTELSLPSAASSYELDGWLSKADLLWQGGEHRVEHLWLELLVSPLPAKKTTGMWESTKPSPAQTSAEKQAVVLNFRCVSRKIHGSCPCWSASPDIFYKEPCSLLLSLDLCNKDTVLSLPLSLDSSPVC